MIGVDYITAIKKFKHSRRSIPNREYKVQRSEWKWSMNTSDIFAPFFFHCKTDMIV